MYYRTIIAGIMFGKRSSRTYRHRYMHLKTFFLAFIYTDQPGTNVLRDLYEHATQYPFHYPGHPQS